MTPDTVTPAKFITFYSFKGGVGRSMALINTASILAARRGFRVLVIDLDLEAPGLSYLNPDEPESSSSEVPPYLLNPGFVDLMADAKARGETADLFALDSQALELKYSQAIDISKAMDKFRDGSLRVMPAGKIDRSYSRNMEALDLDELYRVGLGEPLLRTFKKKLAESGRYDYVLVDSRTGLSDLAGICTRDLADHVMVLSGLNRQNLEGTSEFLREFREATQGKKTFQIVLSPVPNGEDDLMDRRRELAEGKFSAASDTKVKLPLEIPYHPQLALTEEPHIFRRQKGYLFEAYRSIERAMLDGLGHRADTFYRRGLEAIDNRQYETAYAQLRHLSRLDEGDGWTVQLVDQLTDPISHSPQPAEAAASRRVRVELLCENESGKKLLGFVLDQLPLPGANFPARYLYRHLASNAPELAAQLVHRLQDGLAGNVAELADWAQFFANTGKLEQADLFFNRAIEADPTHAGCLGNYANFLKSLMGDLEGAETYYRRALEADPAHANNLGNYALFLENKKGDLAGAETYYRRALEADPTHANNLGNYASFLADPKGDLAGAETYYRRALEADPTHAGHLGNYADFLKNHKGDLAGAETYYQRALEADPMAANILGNYANFLADHKGDLAGGETYYRRALEADPTHAGHLGNYGQFLLGTGRIREAEPSLQQAWNLRRALNVDFLCELCLALWLAERIQAQDGALWERRVKFLIHKGFKRYRWSFDRILAQAKPKLSLEEFAYAQALAAAHQDESKVVALEKFPRWVALEPLDPEA